MTTLVIADGGACHDGEFDKQVALIHAAKAAGCDAYKTQWTSDPLLMARRRGRALQDGYADIYRRYLAWPREWHAKLAERCAEVGIEYMVTAFLPQDVPVIAPYVRRFKIASFEAEDRSLWAAYRALKFRPDQSLIVSLGMGAQRRSSEWPLPVRYLRCVSAYPAPLEALQLARLWPTCDDCACGPGGPSDDGFSDHSDPALTMTGALAVAAGATIIEAHLRLDDTDPANPDAPHAMTPAQFTDYVRLIRLAEVALGTGEKRLQPAEEPMAKYRVGGGVAHA